MNNLVMILSVIFAVSVLIIFFGLIGWVLRCILWLLRLMLWPIKFLFCSLCALIYGAFHPLK